MRSAGALVLGFVLVTSTLVLAKGPNPSPAATRIEGEITAIDSAAQQIVVAGVTVQATEDTAILLKPCGGEAIPILFGDLALGQTVRASGLMDGDVLVAKKIMVKYGGE